MNWQNNLWYTNVDNPPLDLTKPIACSYASSLKHGDNLEHYSILLPQTDKAYEIIGYNWFNLSNGTYDSCCTFPTIEDALASREEELFNVEIKVSKLNK